MGVILKAILKILVAIFAVGVAAKTGKDGTNDAKSFYNNKINKK